MIELPALMAAVATQIAAGTGVRTADFFPEDVNPPFVFLTLDSLREEVFGFGSYGVTINVVVVVAAGDARTGQHLLYEFITPAAGGQSIYAALVTDGSFGLDGVSSTPGEFRALGAPEIAAYRYYGGVLPLEVVVT